MNLLQRLASSAANTASRVYDQANPFDNGRTFKQTTPLPNHQGSVIQQATHGGVANAAGDVVHSFTNVPAAAFNMGRGVADQYITGNLPAAQRAYKLSLQDARNNLVTGLGHQLAGTGQALYDVTGRQSAALLTNNPRASYNANTAAVRDFNKTPFGQVLTPLQHGLANYQVHRDLPQLSKGQQKQVVAQNLNTVGVDPKATLGGQLLTTGLAAGQLVVPEKLVNGVPITQDLAAKGAKVAETAPVGREVNPAQIQQHFKENYKPATDHPAEAQAAHYLQNNPQQAVKDYQARIHQIFGSHNVVAGDDAKYAIPQMRPEMSNPYHEPASTFAKGYYQHLLSDESTAGKPVMITAGGTGAGKTSALKKYFSEAGNNPHDHAAIIDTNLTTVKAAESRMKPALESGRPVHIKYVYRDPVEAYQNGVIPRAAKEGRIISPDTHADTHANSIETIRQLAQKYKNHDAVSVEVIDNSRGAGNSTVVPLDFLANKSYSKSELEAKIHGLLDQQLAEGKLTHEQHQTFKGQPATAPAAMGQTGPNLQRVEQSPNATAVQEFEQKRQKRQLTPQVVENRLTKGGKAGRQNLSPQAQAEISGDHFVRNTKQLADSAVTQANKLALDDLISKAHEALAVPEGKIDDQTVALAQQAMERADTAGKTRDAVAIHDALSEHLVKNGQTIQAASLLYKLSPQGMLYKAMRDLKKATGKDVSPELEKQLRQQIDVIKNAAQGEEKDMARAAFSKTVADNMPQTAANKAIAVWKAGLLSGVKTQGGNFVSNATFAGLHGLSNPLATGIDKLISIKTGERTKALTSKGFGSGALEGSKKGYGTLRHGIDSRNLGGGKYETHGELRFNNKLANTTIAKPANLVFRGMNAADQPFYFAALRNNLADLAKADGINRGLRGAQLEAHVQQVMEKPSTGMLESAKLSAQKSVLGQDSKIASSFSKFAQEHPAAQVLAPFVKVPTNFLSRTIDYTPVGAVKTAVQQIRSGHLDQRALSEAIAESTTGTALIFLGNELAKNNMLSGQYPSDPKEQQRWKAEGITPNSVKVGGKWISLNYLGPVGLLFGAGNDYQRAKQVGNNGVVATVTGAGKNLMGQSFLTGFSGFSNAINDPTRSAKTFVNSEVGSIVPSLSNDVANLFDRNQRETNTPAQSVAARVPGARNNLPIKQDVYGNPLQQRTDPLNLLANPLRPSNQRTNPVIAEVSRLHTVDPNNKDLQVTPTPVDKKISINNQSIALSNPQRHDLQQQIGQATQSAWGQLINTAEYKAMSDTDKANALNNARQSATEDTQRAYLTSNNLATFSKPESKAAIALRGGNITQFAKAKSASSGGSSITVNNQINPHDQKVLSQYNTLSKDEINKKIQNEPDYEFKVLAAKYENDKANGSLSGLSEISRRNAVAKAQVGSNFSKDVRDLYDSSLSKADKQAYLASQPNGQDLYNQMLAYDQSLYKQGVTSKLKYKNGLATTSGGSRKGGGKKGKGKSTLPTNTFASSIKATSALNAKVRNAKVSGPSARKVAFTTKIKTSKPKTNALKLKRRIA